MDWRDEIVSDIGRGMGIEGLDFGDSGIISFEFESRGNLYMEKQDEGVLIYLMQSISRFDAMATLIAALASCHYTRSTAFPIQAGLKGDEELTFLVYLENEAFSPPNIEKVIELLIKQFDQLQAA